MKNKKNKLIEEDIEFLIAVADYEIENQDIYDSSKNEILELCFNALELNSKNSKLLKRGDLEKIVKKQDKARSDKKSFYFKNKLILYVCIIIFILLSSAGAAFGSGIIDISTLEKMFNKETLDTHGEKTKDIIQDDVELNLSIDRKEYNTVDEALSAVGIDKNRISWIPEGYKFENAIHTKYTDYDSIQISYKNTNNYILYLITIKNHSPNDYLNYTECIQINDNDYYIYKFDIDENIHNIVWNIEKISFSIILPINITEDQIYKIIKNIN